MASTRALYGKNNLVTSDEITVSSGKDLSGKQVRHTLRWVPEPGMTKSQTEKAVARAAIEFEDKIKRGGTVDGKMTFAAFAEDFMQRREKVLKNRTIENYRYLLERTNAAIGHIKLPALPNMRPAGWKRRSWPPRPVNSIHICCDVSISQSDTSLLKNSRRSS